MGKVGRPPNSRVDHQKFLQFCSDRGITPTREGFRYDWERRAGARTLADTTAYKFVKAVPTEGVSAAVRSDFEAVYGIPFKVIELDDDPISLLSRIVGHLAGIRGAYYEHPARMMAAAAGIRAMIADVRTAAARRNDLTGAQQLQAADLAGEVGDLFQVFEAAPCMRLAKEINDLGFDLVGPGLKDSWVEAQRVLGRLHHCRVGPDAGYWRRPLAQMPAGAVEFGRDKFTKAGIHYGLAAGKGGDHGLKQHLCVARVMIQGADDEWGLAEAERHLADMPAGTWQVQAQACALRSLLAHKRGHSLDAVARLDEARHITFQHYADEQNPHVGAYDLRLFELDPEKVSQQRVQDARHAVLNSPLKFVGVVDLELIRQCRSPVATVPERGIRMSPESDAT